MNKPWLIIIFILIVASFLLWGQTKTGFAAKEERFFSVKILSKIEEILQNQNLILQEIKELKGKVEIR